MQENEVVQTPPDGKALLHYVKLGATSISTCDCLTALQWRNEEFCWPTVVKGWGQTVCFYGNQTTLRCGLPAAAMKLWIIKAWWSSWKSTFAKSIDPRQEILNFLVVTVTKTATIFLKIKDLSAIGSLLITCFNQSDIYKVKNIYI